MWLRTLILIIAIGFIAILVVKRFTYFHPSYDFAPPIENYTDLYEGNNHAWFLEGAHGNRGKLILFCHGNAGNLTHRQHKLKEFIEMGHSVLIFDYNGYGHSKGVPNESLCYNSAGIFVEFALNRGYDRSNIIPYGESLGGAVATQVAARYNLPKVITEGGIPSVSRMVKHTLPKFLHFVSAFFPEFNSIKHLQSYRGRYLHIHAINDEIIPYDTVDELRKKAVKSLPVEGNHNDPRIPWYEIAAFIDG